MNNLLQGINQMTNVNTNTMKNVSRDNQNRLNKNINININNVEQQANTDQLIEGQNYYQNY